MNGNQIEAESEVSGRQVTIPTRIRRELDISDGDRLCWRVEEDRNVRIRVVKQRNGAFTDFEGYDGQEETEVTAEHDEWGVDDR